MRTLERRPEFSDVRLKQKDEVGGEIEFQLTLRYDAMATEDRPAPHTLRPTRSCFRSTRTRQPSRLHERLA